MIQKTLDVRGLRCPLPILKAQRAICDVKVGGMLEILATDPGAPEDFTDFCNATGHILHEANVLTDGFRFVIERAASS